MSTLEIIKKLQNYPTSPVSLSVVTAAVRPTPEEPRPVVGMARGAVCKTYLKDKIINSPR